MNRKTLLALFKLKGIDHITCSRCKLEVDISRIKTAKLIRSKNWPSVFFNVVIFIETTDHYGTYKLNLNNFTFEP